MTTTPNFQPAVATEIEELRRLRAWKESALAVLNEWEAVWEAAGRPGPLGTSKAAAVLALFTELARPEFQRGDRFVYPSGGAVTITGGPIWTWDHDDGGIGAALESDLDTWTRLPATTVTRTVAIDVRPGDTEAVDLYGRRWTTQDPTS